MLVQAPNPYIYMTNENQNDQKDLAINDKNLYQAFRLMKKKEFEAAAELIKECLAEAQAKQDSTQEGIYYSALGVLYKLKNEYKKAYKCYQHAEHLLPDDHSLKIITAVLLIEQFHQYDSAIRKLDKILATGTKDPAIIHHTLTSQAIALFHMRKKDEAKKKLEDLIAQDFSALRFVVNVDFKMIDLFTKKGFELGLCKEFLQKALVLAKNSKDQTYNVVIEELITRLDLFQEAQEAQKSQKAQKAQKTKQTQEAQDAPKKKKK